jgi:hypothetical protein
MPVRPVFRCEFCGARPDRETHDALQRQMLGLRFGEYVDADPGNWLTWHGRGIYGRTRYACGEHRGDLKADLRETYGTVGRHPWAKGPHRGPATAAPTARASSRARSAPPSGRPSGYSNSPAR